VERGELKEALATARKAVTYAPGRPDTHAELGLVEYLNGDKTAALRELRTAQKGDPAFQRHFDSALQGSEKLRPLREDREFRDKLFPP
jgi:hypothetical protein